MGKPPPLPACPHCFPFLQAGALPDSGLSGRKRLISKEDLTHVVAYENSQPHCNCSVVLFNIPPFVQDRNQGRTLFHFPCLGLLCFSLEPIIAEYSFFKKSMVMHFSRKMTVLGEVGEGTCMSHPLCLRLSPLLPFLPLWANLPVSSWENDYLFLWVLRALPLTCCCCWVKPLTQIPCF